MLNFNSLKLRREPFTTADKEFLRLMAQWIGGEIDRVLYTQQLQSYAWEIEGKNRALAEARDLALQAQRRV